MSLVTLPVYIPTILVWVRLTNKPSLWVCAAVSCNGAQHDGQLALIQDMKTEEPDSALCVVEC